MSAGDEPVQPSGQLRWRARRGMRELDMLLQRYLEQRYPCAPADERHAFARLLEQTDADLLDWLMERATPPKEFADVVGALRPGG